MSESKLCTEVADQMNKLNVQSANEELLIAGNTFPVDMLPRYKISSPSESKFKVQYGRAINDSDPLAWYICSINGTELDQTMSDANEKIKQQYQNVYDNVSETFPVLSQSSHLAAMIHKDAIRWIDHPDTKSFYVGRASAPNTQPYYTGAKQRYNNMFKDRGCNYMIILLQWCAHEEYHAGHCVAESIVMKLQTLFSEHDKYKERGKTIAVMPEPGDRMHTIFIACNCATGDKLSSGSLSVPTFSSLPLTAAQDLSSTQDMSSSPTLLSVSSQLSSTADTPTPTVNIETSVIYDSADEFFRGLGFQSEVVEKFVTELDGDEPVNYNVYHFVDQRFDQLIESTSDFANCKFLDTPSLENLIDALTLFGFRSGYSRLYAENVLKFAYMQYPLLTSIKKCIRYRLSPPLIQLPFPSTDEANSWISITSWSGAGGDSLSNQRTWFRNQRGSPKTNSLEDLRLEALENLSPKTQGERYWFHATRWDFAVSILQKGPRIGEQSEFGRDGAFYLNDDYADACDWFFNIKGLEYRGQFALVIFRLNLPMDQTKPYRGEDLSNDKPRWEQVVYECLSRDVRGESSNLRRMDFLFGQQCSNGAAMQKKNVSKSHATFRMRTDGRPAMQMALRTTRICEHAQQNIIGIVFFESGC